MRKKITILSMVAKKAKNRLLAGTVLLVLAVVLFVLYRAGKIFAGMANSVNPAPVGGNGKNALLAAMKREDVNSSFFPYLLALSDHETGGWRGGLYQKTNNFFSMKDAKVRAKDNAGFIQADGGDFAVFKDASQSVRDFKLYAESHNLDLEGGSPFLSVARFVDWLHARGFVVEAGRASHRKSILKLYEKYK